MHIINNINNNELIHINLSIHSTNFIDHLLQYETVLRSDVLSCFRGKRLIFTGTMLEQVQKHVYFQDLTSTHLCTLAPSGYWLSDFGCII